jgi:exoribonuclease-2
VLKPGLVRAETLPLVFALAGTDMLPRGTPVRARIAGIDLLTLDLHATLAARVDEAAARAPEQADDDEDEEAAEEALAAGGLQLAIDVAEEAPAADADAAAAAAG